MFFLRSGLFAAASVFILTACAQSAPSQATSSAPVPATSAPVTSSQTPESLVLASEQRPMILPSSAGTSTISDDQAGVYARLSRLEADVADIKDQFGNYAPLLQKMPALQDKLGELVYELQRIDARVASAREAAQPLPTVTPKPVVLAPTPAHKPEVERKPAHLPVAPQVKPAPAKGIVLMEDPVRPEQKPMAPVVALSSQSAPASTAVPAVSTKTPAVLQVRVGDDAVRTRIVLDLDQKTGFTYDLDNTEKILVIELEAAAWNAAVRSEFAKSPLVASYVAQPGGAGKTRLIIQLRDPVKILAAQNLLPNAERGNRIVFDLGRVS